MQVYRHLTRGNDRLEAVRATARRGFHLLLPPLLNSSNRSSAGKPFSPQLPSAQYSVDVISEQRIMGDSSSRASGRPVKESAGDEVVDVGSPMMAFRFCRSLKSAVKTSTSASCTEDLPVAKTCHSHLARGPNQTLGGHGRGYEQ